jgi:hypothetical protein
MDLEGEGLLWSRSCAGIFLEGLEKNHINLRISGVSAKIRSEQPAEHVFRASQL